MTGGMSLGSTTGGMLSPLGLLVMNVWLAAKIGHNAMCGSTEPREEATSISLLQAR